jgi:hypothetical protein
MSFRNAAITFSLVVLTPVLVVETTKAMRGNDGTAVPMMAEDGQLYRVEPGEPLSTAMAQGPMHHRTQGQGESGACVPESAEKKPAGSVSCKCYELTKCNGSESRECKRHCRKDLCQCCDI